MDRYHEDLEEYLQATSREFSIGRKIVVNRDCPYSQPPGSAQSEVVNFSLQEPAVGEFGLRENQGKTCLCYGDEFLINEEDLKVFGRHNVANTLAAMAICHALHVELKIIVEAVRNFSGLPNRCQWICEPEWCRLLQ